MARTRKTRDLEYLLRAFPVRDPETGRERLALVVETAKEFVSFHYEVLLADETDRNAVTLRILGIHAPRSVMPGVGPARGFRLYEGLKGTVTLTVRNVDGDENMFRLRLRPSSVHLLSAPPDPFIAFTTEPVELSE